jgi:hypothetical protein
MHLTESQLALVMRFIHVSFEQAEKQLNSLLILSYFVGVSCLFRICASSDNPLSAAEPFAMDLVGTWLPATGAGLAVFRIVLIQIRRRKLVSAMMADGFPPFLRGVDAPSGEAHRCLHTGPAYAAFAAQVPQAAIIFRRARDEFFASGHLGLKPYRSDHRETAPASTSHHGGTLSRQADGGSAAPWCTTPRPRDEDGSEYLHEMFL